MTKQEIDEMAALVVRLRKELEHTTQHLVAHIDALTKSNAQCGEYLRTIEQFHSELVAVRAEPASATEQRDSLKRTLDEWSNADTTPHERVDADDVAEHVVPPMLPLCTTCHGCGESLVPLGILRLGDAIRCPNQQCARTNTTTIDVGFSPDYGPCKATAPVRHE